MKMGVTSYYFDVLSPTVEYILGENSFVHSFDSYLNVLAVNTVISQYFYHKTYKKLSQFQKLGVVRNLVIDFYHCFFTA